MVIGWPGQLFFPRISYDVKTITLCTARRVYVFMYMYCGDGRTKKDGVCCLSTIF